ncbi:amidohydrolase family protein, partial [Frateuria aurantia]
LAGRALFPGFQDAHVYPLTAGLQLLSCDLSTTHSLKDYVGLIVDFAHRHPQHEWITGAGWYGDVFDGGFPNRDLLDELVADRPVFLMS